MFKIVTNGTKTFPRTSGKPRLKLMKNLTITRGDTVKLVCEFSGDGYLKAKWLHLGQEWPSGSANQVERILGFNSSSLSRYNTVAGNSLNAGNTVAEVRSF